MKSELDSLVDQGTITRRLRASADEVRLTGNDVAHPERLGTIIAKDADDSLEFLRDFVETTISIPGRLEQRAVDLKEKAIERTKRIEELRQTGPPDA